MITYQRFMINAHLMKSSFLARQSIDHEHCTMCGAKFSNNPNDLNEGYVTLDGRHWICQECLCDYKNEYGWSIDN